MDKFLVKERICELVNIIYSQYSNVGGALHIVLEDGNLEDNNIQWCLENSIAEITNEAEKKIYTECAELLLKLSYSSRKRTINNLH